VAARIDDAQFAALGMDMERDQLEPHARRVCDRVRALAIHNPHAPARNLTVSAVVTLVRPGRTADWRGLLEQARRELAAAQAAGTEQVLVSEFGAPAD
jgi:GGDEF domain-containing protein